MPSTKESDVESVPEVETKKVSRSDNAFSLWKDFAEITTLHGFSGIARDREQFNQFRWKNILFTIATILCLGMTGKHLYDLIMDYHQYPTTTRMFTETKDELHFPAITLCNCGVFNKMQVSRFSNL